MGGRHERNWSRTIKRNINGVARLKRGDSEHATETRGCLIEIEIEDDTGKRCGYTNAWLFLVLPQFLIAIPLWGWWFKWNISLLGRTNMQEAKTLEVCWVWVGQNYNKNGSRWRSRRISKEMNNLTRRWSGVGKWRYIQRTWVACFLPITHKAKSERLLIVAWRMRMFVKLDGNSVWGASMKRENEK